MTSHAPKLVTPQGPSKSIFQPHPATVGHAPAPSGKTTTTPSGKPGKATPPNGGGPA